ncbi:MAG: DM13 domain-containing protein [Cyanobacteria bacterium J06635_15]
MKLNPFFKVVAFGTLSCAAVALIGVTQISTAQSSELPTLSQPVQLLALKSGTFIAAAAPTAGGVSIVEEDGHHFLEIDEAFSTTDQAPDLHVLLDPSSVPPETYESFTGYINLGSLQTVSGTQRYPIPDDIDLAAYQSVVIWCRMANATMGYAPLN